MVKLEDQFLIDANTLMRLQDNTMHMIYYLRFGKSLERK